MTMQRKRRGQGGFTLIELVVVIIIIAVIAAILIPIILGETERARISEAKDTLAELSKTMRRFRDDTGGWPYANTVWYAASSATSDEWKQFGTNDTAMLISVPTGSYFPVPGGYGTATVASPNDSLLPCSSAPPGLACFNGPYIGRGASMAALIDPWGNAYYYGYSRPANGTGGSLGNSAAPNGIVVLSSAGPDGIDGTNCGGGGCSLSLTNVVAGQCSVPGCDDIIQVVGGAQ